MWFGVGLLRWDVRIADSRDFNHDEEMLVKGIGERIWERALVPEGVKSIPPLFNEEMKIFAETPWRYDCEEELAPDNGRFED